MSSRHESARSVLLWAGLRRRLIAPSAVLGLVVAASPAQSQTPLGSMDVHWNEGATDCAATPQPPLQVHKYAPGTFILRESLCATFEAPFMYLLVGSTKALLIDSGDVSDPNQAPLARTVLELIAPDGSPRLPLVVAHTHRHFDHRAGDSQFAGVPDVQVVGFDFDSVRRYFGFVDWPNRLAHIVLGDRTVDVIPTPGHSPTEVSFYDRNTGLLLTGDFLMPARLLIDDADADLASARRVAAFAKDRPITFVLGAHIEMDRDGKTFPWESRYHPGEHVLQMTREELLALPQAVASFNGFYTTHGTFIMMNSLRILLAWAALALAVLIALVVILIRYFRRRRRLRRDTAPSPRS